MAKKTNFSVPTKSGNYAYYKIKRKVGMRQNKRGDWVPEYKTFYGRSQKEALEKYEKYINAGVLNSSVCLGEFVSWYIENILQPNKSLKESTKIMYINAYHSVFDKTKLTGRRIEDITGAELQAVISADKPGASTRKMALKLLRRFYKYLESQRITLDITRGLVAPAIKEKRNNQDIEVFTNEELAAFTNNTPEDHRLRLLIVLAINTGARIAELLALTYDDIKNGQVFINKNLIELEAVKGSDDKTKVYIADTKTPASVRSVPINEAVNEEVRQHKQWHTKEMLKNGYRTNYIFTTSSGNLYYKSTIRKSYNRLCRLVGVEPRGFHTFRHTFGSRLAAGGVPIQTVSKLMGHTDISVTSKYYINISDSEKIAAIAALNL